MMKQFPVVLCGLALTCCAAPKDTFSLAPSAGQEAIVRDGVPSLVSSKRHVVFMRPLAPQQLSGERPRFVIAIQNRGKVPATLSVANIAVEANRPRKAKLRIFTHTELAAEVESQRNAALVVSALAGAAGAVAASQAGYGYTTGSYSRSTPYGTSYGTYSATTYNPAVAQAAANANADRTVNNMASIEAQAQQKFSELQATVIKDQTLMPGEWHGGVIVLETPAKSDKGSTDYEISLLFDGEEHRFSVAQARQT